MKFSIHLDRHIFVMVDSVAWFSFDINCELARLNRMIVNNWLFIFGNLHVCLGTAKFLFSSIDIVQLSIGDTLTETCLSIFKLFIFSSTHCITIPKDTYKINHNMQILELTNIRTIVLINQALYIQGPVVQSIVSLMSSLVVKMLTGLVSTISNSQVFLMKKCE